MASSFEPLVAAEAPLAAPSAPARTQPWFAALGGDSGFRPDARFSAATAISEPPPDEPDEMSAVLADAVADAERRGREAALAEMASEGAARAALKLSLQRLDEQWQEELGLRIAETVALLCEHALTPLTLDSAALQRRCAKAAQMVGSGIAEARLRLHPDDLALLDTHFAASWPIDPDPGLTRGTVLFDTGEGVVRDGPDDWRMALREALGLC